MPIATAKAQSKHNNTWNALSLLSTDCKQQATSHKHKQVVAKKRKSVEFEKIVPLHARDEFPVHIEYVRYGLSEEARLIF